MAAGAPRIFVSHLSGIAVFDPSGDQVGRVRDLVVMLRVARKPPRVLGLVVELTTRRRIFLPMTRVTGVESGQVITTGVLNVRRFEQRPTERLVFGELLDRRVVLTETGEEVTVLDLSVRQLPARREWEIDRVFVRKGKKAGAFRRGRGEALTVEWSAVTGFSLEEHGQGAESLLATFEQLRPADLANVLHHLSPKRRAEIAAALADDVTVTLPVGGSSGLGVLGYVAAAAELAEQLGDREVDRIVCALGSGGTVAGLALGTGIPITGVTVSRKADAAMAVVEQVAGLAAEVLREKPGKLDHVTADDSALGEGYGVPTDEVWAALRLFARTEGIVLDPVYTGKAAAALVTGVRPGETVVFMHTGGTPAVYGYAPDFVAEASR